MSELEKHISIAMRMQTNGQRCTLSTLCPFFDCLSEQLRDHGPLCTYTNTIDNNKRESDRLQNQLFIYS